MSMFDTIVNVPAKCPRCDSESFKDVQIKCGMCVGSVYEFGKDIVDLYSNNKESINNSIIGVAYCDKCGGMDTFPFLVKIRLSYGVPTDVSIIKEYFRLGRSEIV